MRLQIEHCAFESRIDLVDVDATPHRLIKRMYYGDLPDTKDAVLADMVTFGCGFRDGWDEARHSLGSVNFDGRVLETASARPTAVERKGEKT